ncbi:hypothetical protein NL676_027649 [Syzygium grande]|nr:hypothetical protein NL676_027649 [Syzygium grande]
MVAPKMGPLSGSMGFARGSKLTFRPYFELKWPWRLQALKLDSTLKLEAAMASSYGKRSRMSMRQWAGTNVRRRSLAKRSRG